LKLKKANLQAVIVMATEEQCLPSVVSEIHALTLGVQAFWVTTQHARLKVLQRHTYTADTKCVWREIDPANNEEQLYPMLSKKWNKKSITRPPDANW
jgi:hypothetical protein